jgi:hypothetical protein
VDVEDALHRQGLLPLLRSAPTSTATRLEAIPAPGATILLEATATLPTLVPTEPAPGLGTPRLEATTARATTPLPLIPTETPTLLLGASRLDAVSTGPHLPGETPPGLLLGSGTPLLEAPPSLRSTRRETRPLGLTSGLPAPLAHETASGLGTVAPREPTPRREALIRPRTGLFTGVLARTPEPTLVALATPRLLRSRFLGPVPTPDVGRMPSPITTPPVRGWPLAPQAEALALLEQLALAHHVPEDALDLGLLPGVQAGELQELLHPERVLGFGQMSFQVLRKFGHESSQGGERNGP